MPAKRKLDTFDPNKSDSNDTDFDPTDAAPRRSAKKSRKSHSKRSSGGAKKRARYAGSDVSDDDVDDSLEELSFDEPSEEEEEVEMNEKTGRAVRKATKTAVSYQEDSDSDVADIAGDIDESDEDQPKKRPSNRRSRQDPVTSEEDEDEIEEEVSPRKRLSKIVKLKVSTPAMTRSSRAGSGARTTRRGESNEPTSAGLPARRTRGSTHEAEPEMSLSNSGRHVIRDGQSAEPVGRPRATRGGKGVPAAETIKEDLHETSFYEQQEEADVTMATEIAGTDDQDDVAPVLDDDDDDKMEDELAGPGEDKGEVADAEGDDDDDDDIPIARGGRTRSARASAAGLPTESIEEPDEPKTTSGRLTRGSKTKQKKSGAEASSDFDPDEAASEEEELTASDTSPKKAKSGDDDYASSLGRGRRRPQAKSKSSSRRRASPGSEADELDQDELAEELNDLKSGSRRHRPRRDDSEIIYERKGRTRKAVDYSIKPMADIYAQDEDGEEAAPTPTRRARGGRGGASQPWERNLYTTFGPFGGGGGPAPVIGGPWGTGAIGGVDSDSSDDENMQRPANVGGNVGMTPTSAFPPGLLPGLGQANNPEAMGGGGGAPNVGKIKSQKALADADPLGVDQNIDFSKVGGLDGHIDQLKEMVQMPLLYPELFLKYNVTPPRGVLFHGPPGTGKTLLARALAARVGAGGRKVTFYMRKGADALSKWVGEAERQLRLLFEEARKTQPSIIFFDEIDGLAPVRSSKQEQIHASIVSTLLALMDGMDGRGQVIVIGATNRPDNIDPALRRPGRFDREFYFPLPDIEARKSIINIHTEGWGIDDSFKDNLANITKGYGGADLRALCTEAALNSIQRTYPQIYSSNDKLLVDADKIKITAKDFMLSVKKMIPSSERSTSSGATPLPKAIEPLLRQQLKNIETILDGLIPIKKKMTALQEAMYEQYDDADQGFGRETLQQEFEKSRVFRPRLLIGGEPGMGQAYLGGAILNHFEGLHVQNFDLPTIFSDSARVSNALPYVRDALLTTTVPEAAIVQLFSEVKRHKPSVIYLPGIETWYHTLPQAVITTFLGLLKAIPPTDPVLVLGIMDTTPELVAPDMLRDLFGFSRNNRFLIERPSKENREEFFQSIVTYATMSPKNFPEPLNRKKRKLEVLEIAPLPPPKPPTKEELKAQKKRDHQLLNLLKVQIQPIVDQIHRKYKKFRNPVIQQSQIQYLFDEQDPSFVRPDIPQFRPFELDNDKHGVHGLRETASGKFFYNLETTTIEERLSNGFYARPQDFLTDIRSLAKDAKNIGDNERTLKANELLANVEVDIANIEASPAFADCENVYRRQLQRTKEREEKLKKRAAGGDLGQIIQPDVLAVEQSGPLTLGEVVPGKHRPVPLMHPLHGSSSLSNGVSVDGEHQSNGTSVPSRTGDDHPMSGTDDHVSQNSPMQPPSLQKNATTESAGNAAKLNTQFSQKTWHEISQATSPSQLINDASTTTSGKKTSEGWSTQATNGLSNQNSSPVGISRDSDLPDTQRDTQDTSSDEWLHSQAHGLARGQLTQGNPSQASSGAQSQPPSVPPFNAPPRLNNSRSGPSGFANLLNDSPVEPNLSQVSSEKDNIIDDSFMDDLLRRFVEGSSGCSVEQLEQINRELMETLWKMRGEWNRSIVAAKLVQVFNATIGDIEEMQRVLQASQQQSQAYSSLPT